MGQVESKTDVSWIQIAACFALTCCIPLPNIWAGGAIGPLGIWYLGLASPFTATPFLMLLVVHVYLCRILTRYVVRRMNKPGQPDDAVIPDSPADPTIDEP